MRSASREPRTGEHTGDLQPAHGPLAHDDPDQEVVPSGLQGNLAFLDAYTVTQLYATSIMMHAMVDDAFEMAAVAVGS